MEPDMHEFDGRVFEMEDQSSKPQVNVIKNSDDEEEDEETLLNNHPDMLHRFKHQDLRQNEEFKNFAQDPTNFREIHGDEFGVMIKTKRDLHKVLSIEQQLFLPSVDTCPQQFLYDIMSNDKQVFTNNEIKHITVPRLPEFNADGIFKMAMQDPRTRAYLPELTEDHKNSRSVSCKFLFASKSFSNPAQNLTQF
jgi:hypothetical protein